MAILLRKLTRKSVLGFGKYAESTVQHVIDTYHTRLLRWYYYNSSNITFTDDILEEIGITDEFKINKPGKDPELGEKLDQKKDSIHKQVIIKTTIKFGGSVENAIMGIESHRKRVENAKLYKKQKSRHHEDSLYFSKSSMKARNEGHF